MPNTTGTVNLNLQPEIQVQQLEKQLSNATKEITKVTEKLNKSGKGGDPQLQQRLIQLEQNKIKTEELLSSLRQMADMKVVPTQEFSQLTTEINNSVGSISKLETQIDSLKSKVSSLKSKSLEYAQKIANAPKVQTEAYKKLEQSLKSYTALMDAQKSKVSSYSADIEDLKKRRDLIKVNVDMYEDMLSKGGQLTNSQSADYSTMKDKLESITAELDTLINKQEKAEKSLNSQKSTIQDIESEMQAMRVSGTDMEYVHPEKVEALKQGYQEINTEIDEQEQNLANANQKLEEEGRLLAENKIKQSELTAAGKDTIPVEQTQEWKKTALQTQATATNMGKVVNQLNNADGASKRIGQSIVRISSRIDSIARRIQHLTLNVIRSIPRYIQSAWSRMTQLLNVFRGTERSSGNILKNILRWGFGISGTFMLIRKLRSVMTEGFSTILESVNESINNADLSNVEVGLNVDTNNVKQLSDTTKQLGDDFRNLDKQIKSTNTTLENFGNRSAMTTLKSMVSSINDLKASLQQLKISWGAAFIPIVNMVLPYLQMIVNWLNKVVSTVAGFIAALTGHATYLRGIKQSVSSATSGTKKDTKATKDNTKAKKENADAINDQLSGLDDLNVLRSDQNVDSPIEDLADDLDDLGSGVGGGLADLLEEVPVPEWLQKLADWTRDILTKIITPIKEAWAKVGDYVVSAWKRAFHSLRTFLRDIIEDFADSWAEKGEMIATRFFEIIGDTGNIIANITDALHRAWNENENGRKIWDAILAIVQKVLDGIRQITIDIVQWTSQLNLTPMVTAFREWLESLEPVAETFMNILFDIWNKALKPILTWAFDGENSGIAKLFRIFRDFNKKIDWNSLRENLGKIWEAIGKFGQTVGEGLLLFLQGLSDKLANFVNSADFERLCDKIAEWLNSITPEDIANGLNDVLEIIKIIAHAIENVWSWVKKLIDFVLKHKDTIMKVLDFIASHLTEILVGATITRGIANVGKLVGKFIEMRKIGGILGGISKSLSGLSGTASTAGGTIASSLFSGFSSAWSSLGGLNGILKTDLSVIGGAGTATEIGLTMATGIVGGIVVGLGGLELGKTIGKYVTIDGWDTEIYNQYKGIKGSFDLISDTVQATKDLMSMAVEDSLKPYNKAMNDLSKSVSDGAIPSMKEMEKTARDNSYSQREYAQQMQSMYDEILKTHPELATLAQALEDNKIKVNHNVDALVQINEGLKLFEANGGDATATLQSLSDKYGDIDRVTRQYFKGLEDGSITATAKQQEHFRNVQAVMQEYNNTLNSTASETENANERIMYSNQTLEDFYYSKGDNSGLATYYNNLKTKQNQAVIDSQNTTSEMIRTNQSLDDYYYSKGTEAYNSYIQRVKNETNNLPTQEEGVQKGTNYVQGFESAFTADDASNIALWKQSVQHHIDEGLSPEEARSKATTTVSAMDSSFSLANMPELQTFGNNVRTAVTTGAPTNEEMSAIGNNIITGLKQGMLTALGTIATALSPGLRGIITLVQTIFITHSPSVVMQNIGMNIIQGLINGWQQGIPSMMSAITNFGTQLIAKFNSIKSQVLSIISSMVSSVRSAISGLISSVSSAISNIRSAVSNIGSTISSYASNAYNSISSRITIPRHATGQVIPPSMSEYLAILGDNNQETEVVSPLSTMKQAMIEALAEMGGFGGGNSASGDIIIQIDGREVFRAMQTQNSQYKKQTGQSAFA